jgi:pyruvate dehydrogenase E2 component (dihydrolipoamide acetyltransferase)
VARRIPLRGIQRIVANRTLAGVQSTAHVTAMAEVDASNLIATARATSVDISGLTLTHLLIRATALCLRKYPRLNAAIDDQSICEYADVNIVVALSLPSDDLLGVVIKKADERPLADIVAELRVLRERAEAGGLSLEDVQGGTFTLSNYGMLQSVVWATPILAPGQAAILGIGRATPRLVPDDTAGQGWVIRPILPLSLTYDHRIVNGVPAGRFIDDLAAMLREPKRLLG